jgi:hypothetical protein
MREHNRQWKQISGGKMKKRATLLTAIICSLALSAPAFAQVGPIDYEAGGHGADWTWTVFENDTNPAVEIIDNPHSSGINTSATVAQFTALQAGMPWAGCESLHGSDIGSFSINAANSTIKIMVYKSVISNVGIKFARPDSGADVEILVANTLVNQWEELTFDFAGRIGSPNSTDVDQIIIFPDFNLDGRSNDVVVYFDNITFSEQVIPEGPEVAAPTPTLDPTGVISLFSNAYSNITVDTWSAEWDVADVTDVQIEGNDTKLYSGFVYAGIEFTSQTIDATDMSHFHMDFWTADPTASPAVFKIKLVDFGANGVWDGGGDDVEHELIFDANSTPALESNTWISFDLPLDDFTGLTTTGHLAQLIISGDPNTVYIDNVLFYDETIGVDETFTSLPADYILKQNYPNPFNPTTTINYSMLSSGHVSLKLYDSNGRLVKDLFTGEHVAGSYQMDWDGTDNRQNPVASGTYFYQLAIDGKRIDTKSLTLLK